MQKGIFYLFRYSSCYVGHSLRVLNFILFIYLFILLDHNIIKKKKNTRGSLLQTFITEGMRDELSCNNGAFVR